MDNVLKEFLTAKTADGLAESTMRDYRMVLGRFCDALTLDQLSRATVRQYVADLRTDNGWSEGTIGIHIRYIRAFLRWLHIEGYTARNYALAIKAPKKAVRWDELLTHAEIKQLLQAASKGKFPERDKAIILFLMDTGIRRGEFFLLKRDQVRENGDNRLYLQFDAPKTGDKRFCILGRTTARALRAYLATRTDADPALWYGEQGPYQYSAMYRMLRRHAKTAGIDPSRVHPHVFRKIFATWWIKNGGDEQRLMALGGWNGPEMLRIYVQLGNLEDLLDGHADYSPVDNFADD